MPERAAVEYLLPLLRRSDAEEDELVRYLQWLCTRVEVTVVDASDRRLFAALGARLPAGVRHVPPSVPGLNGKARGVMTGMVLARHDEVIVADDDVRYDDRSLEALISLLDHADFVRPQNVYTSYPWFARWDTARCLVGRAFGGDFGGTVGVRRSTLLRAGGYSTDVLFENLELERTIAVSGGRVVVARGLLVPRRPPTFRHFAGQRVRQAYDDFAQPARLAVELALLPAFLLAAAGRSWRTLLLLALAGTGVAEVGRRADGARGTVPPTMPLWAPAWMLERAIAVWVALGHRLRGGIPYAGSRVVRAATPLPRLRQRIAAQGALS
ncbi:glycosyltransferase family 2 protein [Microbacterium sp. CFBP9034]|uniref:glycosyltransferase n=1 Tax=Microbacterium sp. CFBP9034 TaxID=3096540 RepID=UPI002A6A8224|nr:glycosyltransferase family 2 protein [Microbacterium sp. CFBP9034]MDY0908850.1 glycosyltransferase family 2 protein [Microbacterium sp. CFBP9034]